ncbi:MAG: DUF1499 domain-containing protein [Cellvibrionaceae bacterium]
MNALVLWQCGLILLAVGFIFLYRLRLINFKLFAAGLAFSFLSCFVLGLISLYGLFFWEKATFGIYISGVLALTLGLMLVILISKIKSVPRIHDITTDIDNPPLFQQAAQQREVTDNSLEYNPDNLRHQQQAYPYIQPLYLSDDVDAIFKRALAAADVMGWIVYHIDNTQHVFEAKEVSALFGFADDIIVLVQHTDSGSRIDVRSASRVGASDIGANAKRIRRYLAILDGSSKVA